MQCVCVICVCVTPDNGIGLLLPYMGLAEMINESTWLTVRGRLLIEFLGGDDIANALYRHHEGGESLRSLAKVMDYPIRSLARHLSVARVRLRRLGIMPPAWERQPKAAKMTRPMPVAARW